MKSYEQKFAGIEILQNKANEISELINNAEQLGFEKGLMRNALFVHALGQAEEASMAISQFLSDCGEELNEQYLEKYLEIADRGICSLRFSIEQILQGGIVMGPSMAMSLSI